MLLLRNVSRRDGGLYQCISTDTDTFDEVSGNMTLTVNCKAWAPVLRFWNQRPSLTLSSCCACRPGSRRGGAQRGRRRGPRGRAERHVQRPLVSAHAGFLAKGQQRHTHTHPHTHSNTHLTSPA